MGSHRTILNWKNLLNQKKDQRALCKNISSSRLFLIRRYLPTDDPLSMERSTKIAFSGREKFALRYVDCLLAVCRGVCVYIGYDSAISDLGSAVVEGCGRSTSYVRSEERSSLSEHCFVERLECWFTKYEHILVERNTFKMGTCR
jgi:hypothetical protein